jgi:hypothetical protein
MTKLQNSENNKKNQPKGTVEKRPSLSWISGNSNQIGL